VSQSPGRGDWIAAAIFILIVVVVGVGVLGMIVMLEMRGVR
jgi:hypothetical protein